MLSFTSIHNAPLWWNDRKGQRSLYPKKASLFSLKLLTKENDLVNLLRSDTCDIHSSVSQHKVLLQAAWDMENWVICSVVPHKISDMQDQLITKWSVLAFITPHYDGMKEEGKEECTKEASFFSLTNCLQRKMNWLTYCRREGKIHVTYRVVLPT